MSKRRRGGKSGLTYKQSHIESMRETLELAREAISQQEDPLLMDRSTLETVLLLADKTAYAQRKGYTPQRELLMDIYGFLIGRTFPWRKLDVDWDGEGKVPSQAFAQYLKIISIAVAQRLRRAGSRQSIKHPLTGETCLIEEVRPQLAEHLMEHGHPEAARAIAA